LDEVEKITIREILGQVSYTIEYRHIYQMHNYNLINKNPQRPKKDLEMQLVSS